MSRAVAVLVVGWLLVFGAIALHTGLVGNVGSSNANVRRPEQRGPDSCGNVPNGRFLFGRFPRWSVHDPAGDAMTPEQQIFGIYLILVIVILQRKLWHDFGKHDT
jgi:hypothetical protein